MNKKCTAGPRDFTYPLGWGPLREITAFSVPTWIQCKICGRRISPRILTDHDGDAYIALPEGHKVKKWWKKGLIGRKKQKKARK